LDARSTASDGGGDLGELPGDTASTRLTRSDSSDGGVLRPELPSVAPSASARNDGACRFALPLPPAGEERLASDGGATRAVGRDGGATRACGDVRAGDAIGRVGGGPRRPAAPAAAAAAASPSRIVREAQ